MPTQAELARLLQQATTPEATRDAALALLDATLSRQHIDEALRQLQREAIAATLTDANRPILRNKAIYYFEHPEKDKAGMIREGITRLLVQIGHPDDLDVYLCGVLFYQHQPVNDVAQNLRAAALAGLATVNLNLACTYATRLLGEADTSVFNCEPSTTAIEVLLQGDLRLPIYQFVLHRGEAFATSARAEAVARALESLGPDFPARLYRDLAQRYIDMDEAVTQTGIIDYIINQQRDDLMDVLETIITQTRHDDLHRYGLVMLAASRQPDLISMLYRLARFSPLERVGSFIEALELTTHAERDTLLAQLHKRNA